MNSPSTSVLELSQGVSISSILTGATGVFLGLSDGRILRVDAVYSNAYLTGNRSVYAQIRNVMGNFSNIAWANLMYRLSDYVVRLNNQVVTNTYKAELPIGAIQSNDVTGVFTTPVLWGGSDFGYWDNLVYNQVVPSNTQVVVGVRVGATPEEVASSEWLYFKYSGTSVNKSLEMFNSKGAYIQASISMKTTVANLTPQVSSLTLAYQTKYAVYLFTRKFSLDKATNLKSGFITANIITPAHTEVKFGIGAEDSKDWNDYTPVEIDKSFEMPANIKDQFKVGIKLMTESLTNAATVDGFALMLSGDVDNELNRLYQSSSSSSS